MERMKLGWLSWDEHVSPGWYSKKQFRFLGLKINVSQVPKFWQALQHSVAVLAPSATVLKSEPTPGPLLATLTA